MCLEGKLLSTWLQAQGVCQARTSLGSTRVSFSGPVCRHHSQLSVDEASWPRPALPWPFPRPQGTVVTGQAQERARSGPKSQPFRQPGFPLSFLPGSLLHCPSVQGRCEAFYCSPEQPAGEKHTKSVSEGLSKQVFLVGGRGFPERESTTLHLPSLPPSLLKACKAGPRRLCLPGSWLPVAEAVGRPLWPQLPVPPRATGANMLLWGLRLAPDSLSSPRAQSSLLSHLYCPVGHFPLGAGELAVESGLYTGTTPGLMSLTPTSCSLDSLAPVRTWHGPCCQHGLGGTRGSVFLQAPGSSPSC